MILRYLNYLAWLLILVFLQVLILNNILLFDYATPFLYIYIIFFVDSSLLSKNQLMILAFFLGLLVDIGANTLGMHAASTVLLAFCRPALLKMFSQSNEDVNSIRPTMKSMTPSGYFKYVLFGSLIHHTLLIFIEYFKVTSLFTLSLRILFSTLLTTICIFAVERVRSK